MQRFVMRSLGGRIHHRAVHTGQDRLGKALDKKRRVKSYRGLQNQKVNVKAGFGYCTCDLE